MATDRATALETTNSKAPSTLASASAWVANQPAKNCQIGPELANWLVGNTDVIVSGHEHTYQRTHRLACVTVDSFDETCLSEDGAIWVINGTGGRNWAVDQNDPEAPYFAALMGNKRLDDWGYGTVEFVATASALSGTFRCGGEYVHTDSFTMTR